MTENVEKRINQSKKMCALALTVLTVAVGAAFIVQVLRIYALGDKPYTVENITKYFAEIAVLFWVWIAAIIGIGVFFVLFPDRKKKITACIEPRITLKKLQKRAGVANGEWKKIRYISRIVNVVCVLLWVLTAILCVVFLADETYVPQIDNAFFKSHPEVEILLLRCMAWIIAAFLLSVFAVYFDGFVTKKEIAETKALLAIQTKGAVMQRQTETHSAWQGVKAAFQRITSHVWFKRSIQIVLGVCAVVLIVIGIGNGGMADVLAKAVKICTQCIGLG